MGCVGARYRECSPTKPTMARAGRSFGLQKFKSVVLGLYFRTVCITLNELMLSRYVALGVLIYPHDEQV